ncbi:MAG: BrnT family toxin [Roseiarcus sp.]
MQLAWDRAKSTTNLRLRGFGFDYAALIFSGATIETPDNRRAYGEIRIRAIGGADADVLVVVYTDRDDIRWIVSARKANRKERRQWQSFVNP